MRVWRICKEHYAATAYSGEGARLFSARWNSAGTSLVYTSLSLSLAAIEVFVHLEVRDEPGDLVSIAADLPVAESRIEKEKLETLAKLSSDWRNLDNRELQRMGDEWIRSMRSLTMMVPSAVIDGEWNVLVNPAHSDAAKIKVETTKPFRFDPRMFDQKS
jgi:RES domain-containing protein